MSADGSVSPDDRWGPLLSVRSEVERTVDPDGVALHGQISITRGDKADALRAVAAMHSLKIAVSESPAVPRSRRTYCIRDVATPSLVLPKWAN